MPKPKARVKGSASRGLTRTWKKWILLLLVVLLLIPAKQVAVVRCVNPPLTLPMLIDSLAGPLLDQERAGIVLHDLDGGAAPEATHHGAVCERDRDGARDLRGRSGLAVLFRRQRARSYAGAIGHAGGGPAESERLGSDEAGQDVTMASAAHSAT
jgi:hypothetical protein